MVVNLTEANFNARPVETDKMGEMAQEIRTSRKGITERLVVEHELADAQQANHGKHIMGSARAFVGDTNSLTPETPPYLLADGYAKGRMQFHPTGSNFFVHNGTTWVEIGYCSLVGNQTIAGAKAFTTNPTVPTTALESLADASVASVSALVAYIDAAAAAARDAAIRAAWPVGAVYIQYPGYATPGSLFPGVWSNISDAFPGGFFRSEGGNASAFGSGLQAAMVLDHTHAHSHDTKTWGYEGATPSEGIRDIEGSEHSPSDYSASAVTIETSDPGVSSGTHGDENRPANYSIRIWMRSA